MFENSLRIFVTDTKWMRIYCKQVENVAKALTSIHQNEL